MKSMKPKQTFTEDTVFIKNSNVATLKTDEGIILTKTNSNNCTIYHLDNEVSCKIWKLIERRSSFKKIKSTISTVYQIDVEKIEEDLNNFIKNLYSNGLIITKHKECN